MVQKNSVRKKYFLLRKKNYYEVSKDFFIPFLKLIKLKFKKKKINLALYYPASFEINVLKLLEFNHISNHNLLLPVIEETNAMNFSPWKKNEVLIINKYGMLEPIKSKQIIPNIMLVPLLTFDKKKFRLGYGKGFYDRYLNKYLRTFKNILTVGVAFSFQKYHKLPINDKDVKLDYILTEKGMY
ncbi:MAG: 5-formyltetrahydrofolate cyclo-ligase [Gammaproteobacteria bacterium]|jgi:5-formyltetrahydrofolate cyclo-ligase|nr:5-formyltetrahydrofolate cyclo-ligase [Gammaproteobacteria bacterium]